MNILAVLAASVISYFSCFTCTDIEQELTNSYCGFVIESTRNDLIEYETKRTEEYAIKGNLPTYGSVSSNTNCANVAGAVVLGYYDRVCENLIPNYKSYNQLGGTLKYKGVSEPITNTVSILYDLMGTDAGMAGTTFSGFNDGMTTYVRNAGYEYSYTDVGTVDWNKCVANLEEEKPIALFLDEYSMISQTNDTGKYEDIKIDHYSAAHVVVACGYKKDFYYDANNQLIAERSYLKVSTGNTGNSLTYLCLDNDSKIDYAIAIDIN